MLITTNLTPNQIKLIRKIVTYQLASLERIYNKKTHIEDDIERFLNQIELARVDWEDAILEEIYKFENLYNDPGNFSELNKEDLSTIRLILNRLENKYKNKYPKSLASLWERLKLIEDLQLKDINLN